MEKEVAVIGVGQSSFVRGYEGSIRELAFEAFREGDIEGVRWYDRDLCLWLHFGYVGEVRFRGLDAAIPVYSLGYAGTEKETGS